MPSPRARQLPPLSTPRRCSKRQKLTGAGQVVLVIRFSVIPSHFSTAVFSTCNVKFWHFAVATFVTLPKQIILVYLGVLLVQNQSDAAVKDTILAVGFLITVAAGVFIYLRMRKYKKILLDEQAGRKADRERARLKENAESSTSPVSGEGDVAAGYSPRSQYYPRTAGPGGDAEDRPSGEYPSATGFASRTEYHPGKGDPPRADGAHYYTPQAGVGDARRQYPPRRDQLVEESAVDEGQTQQPLEWI